MCFGNQVQTNQTKTTLPDYLSNAAQSNIANASSVTGKAFTPYTGEMTAPLSADQNTAGSMLRTVAGSSNPYTSDIEGLYRKFANAPAGTVNAPSILGGGRDVNSTTISDYMNPYTDAVLQPQLFDIANQGAETQKGDNAAAVFGGAFGDSRNGIKTALDTYYNNMTRANTIGQAYNNAFQTAAGLRQNDINTNLNVQNQNNSNKEVALQRGQQGGQDLNALDQYNTGRTVDLAKELANFGSTETANRQAGDTANLSEFMRGQQWSPQMLQLMTQVLAGTPHDATSTTTAPDNTGYALLGSIIGAGGQAAKAFALPGAPSAGGGAPFNISSGNYGGTGGTLGGLY